MTNKEAIKRLEWVKKRISDITYSPESFEALNLAIKALELVNDSQDLVNDLVKERPKGKWIDKGSLTSQCNNCGRRSIIEYDFCPMCGADMREEANNG